MTKIKVKKIVIAERIYIRKKDVYDSQELLSAYTYHNGDELLSTIDETDDYYLVPSNSYYKLEFDELEDCRNYTKLPYSLNFNGELRPEQAEAVQKLFIADRARSGLLQAKPGWGKTFAACALIANNSTKTLVLVHTKLLFYQWLKELDNQLPGVSIGTIGDGKFTIGDVTVAIYKTAYNNIKRLQDEFSLLIVDEAHKCPADMFSSVVNNINCRVKIAITATPRRKDGKHIYLQDFFSPYLVTAQDSRLLAKPSVKVKKTDFKFPVLNPKSDWAKAMNKLCSDQSYLQLIANTAIGLIKQNRCPLIIGERVQMLKDLQALIPDSICVIGSSTETEREDALLNLGSKYKAILTTKLFDEGISCHRLDTLILTCPSNNPVQLEQRVGRIERLHPDKQFPLIVDIWLSGKVVDRQQTARMQWYIQHGYNIL